MAEFESHISLDQICRFTMICAICVLSTFTISEVRAVFLLGRLMLVKHLRSNHRGNHRWHDSFLHRCHLIARKSNFSHGTDSGQWPRCLGLLLMHICTELHHRHKGWTCMSWPLSITSFLWNSYINSIPHKCQDSIRGTYPCKKPSSLYCSQLSKQTINFRCLLNPFIQTIFNVTAASYEAVGSQGVKIFLEWLFQSPFTYRKRFNL